MLKVALTGGIATGKSYVVARLKDRGIPTIDADEIVHDALGPGTSTAKTIAATFGGEFLRPDGSVHRSLLGAKVFGDPSMRRKARSDCSPPRLGHDSPVVRRARAAHGRRVDPAALRDEPRERLRLHRGDVLSAGNSAAANTRSGSNFRRGSAAADRGPDARGRKSAACELRDSDRWHEADDRSAGGRVDERAPAVRDTRL